jgi:undecaprenyl diphosphate synthase
MTDLSPEGIAQALKGIDICSERMPRSVAIIMDGNGRWGRARGLSRSAGHEAGGKNVRKIVTESARLGLSALTLYSFSIENWRRPREEINTLMHLYAQYLREERETIMSHNIRLRHLGSRDGLPRLVLDELDETLEASSVNTGMYLCLALNYGSRAEMAQALRSICRRVGAGELTCDDVNESIISDSLDTAGVPDPDLVIRTSGEMRLSNFLLWQLSYAEFYVADVHWPDFDEPQFHKALQTYAGRNRRYGGVDSSNQ